MAGPGGVEAGRAAVRVLPDLTQFARSLQKYLERIEARTVLTIKSRADTKQIAADVAAAVKAAEHGTHIRIGSDVDTSDLVTKTRRAAKVAEKAAKLKLPLDLDLKAFTAGISKAAALLASGLKLGALPLILASSAASAAALAKALAPAAGALAALPGIAFAAAAGIAALKIGLSGVSDALKGNAESMAKLAPSARDFVTEVQRLGPAWAEVRKTIQGRLFDQLGKDIAVLAQRYLPLLQVHLGGIAAAWNTAFRDTASVLASAGAVASLTKALGTSSTAAQSLSGALAPVVSILVNLAPFGAEFAASMAGGLFTAAEGAAAFVARAKETGQLAEFFATVKTTLISLGQILGQLGGIFKSVFDAASASGAGLLGNLSTILGSVRAFLSSVEGQNALTTFFAAAATVLQTVLPLILTLASAFGSTLAPAIAQVAKLLGPGLQAAAQAIVGIITALINSGALDALASGLTEGLSALGPALIPLASALGGIVKAAAPLLPLVGKIAAVLAGVLASALTAIEPLLTALVEAITTSGLDVVLADLGKQLGPLIAELVANLLPTIKALLPLLGPILQVTGALLKIVIAILTPLLHVGAVWTELVAIKALTPIVELLAKALTWLTEKALAPFAEWLGKLGAIVSTMDWATAWQAIVTGVKAAGDYIGALPGRIMAALFALPGQLVTWAGELFAFLGRAFWDGLTYLVGYWASMPERAIVAVFALRDRAAAFFADVFARAKQLFSEGISALVGYAASLPSRALSALGSLAGAVQGVFGGAGSWLIDAGRRIIQGLIDGISAMVGRLRDQLRSVTNLIPSWKGPPRTDAKLLTANGRLIMSGLIDGIAKSLPALRSQLAAVTGDIEGTFSASAASVTPTLPVSVTAAVRPAPIDPGDLREPEVNLTAYFQVGDDPVIQAVEKAMKRNPETVAQHARTGERLLARRG